jgi:CRISPR-associated endonuclease/helicase Cas3
MARIEDQQKQEIKQQVWLIVQRNRGIRTAEIADRLNLDRRRVQNYLAELREEGKIDQEGWGWFSLEFRGPRLFRFELSPEEVITLYLGARLLVKQHDQRNEPAETALRKLAAVLRSDAPIGGEIERVADELAQRGRDPLYQSVFRTIAHAYAYRKQIDLVYAPLGKQPFETRFAVYLIEPSLVGAATYIIGHSSIAGEVREYKLGRIQAAAMTQEPYEIPVEYQGLEVLRQAWSVIGGEAKTEVILRFSPQVLERVQETRWHPLQETSPDPEKPGWLRWQTRVPSTLDMLPWIRGWGADVEVVEPEELRKALEREVRRMAEVYQIGEVKPQDELIAHLRKDKTEQLLFTHLTEASQLAEKFAEKVGLPEVGKIAGLLHDFGKASKEYQD